jgi:dihydrolipoamide dehydrogenase
MSSIDKEAALAMQKILMKQGVEFRLSTKVLSATKGDPGYIDVECVKSGEKSKIECNKVLLSVGRRPFVKNLNLECLGVELEKVWYL